MFEGLRFDHWKALVDEDRIVTLSLDRADSSVNAISHAVLEELAQIVERLSIEAPAGVIVHSAKPSGFAVGADIKEFVAYARAGTVLEHVRYGQQVFQSLAALPCPTVAAIHGVCMGGGTELALACRHRIAADDQVTRIALPEVQLGIHPGWGGTARLPRLIGATEALPLMLAGKTLSAHRALAVGLVDRTAPAEGLLGAARQLLVQSPRRALLWRAKVRLGNTWIARQLLAPVMRKRTAAKVRKEHYPAPFALIDVWQYGGSSMRDRLQREARSVADLAETPTARNLIRIFFLRERLKNQGGDADAHISRVHVAGAGVMGGDIASWCALRGFDVTLGDRAMQYIQPALERARQLYEKRLKAPDQVEAAMQRLHADPEGTGARTADLALEAIYEDGSAKRELYALLEPQLRADSILASNTSSIPIDELRTGLMRPQNFLGLHFFNPVAHMPLIEVVRHDQLDHSIEFRALSFCKALGKLPVVVKGTPGFLVNRILMPYLLEALRLYAEGVPGALLDHAAEQFGMPVGPIELADTIGLDVCASVGRELAPFLGLAVPAQLDARLESGKRGKKDGQGLYVWTDGKPHKPAVASDYVAPPDLQERMILPMLNEAVACLAEGVVADADLLDAGVIFGTGFAPFRGGPISFVRSEGSEQIRQKLERLAELYGDRFKPKRGWDHPALMPGAQPEPN
ncbi:MAG: 3-hydroxyacyl-CoA dehydrogenase NAD-binding domain-containing protein [Rhodanobacter sp.]